MTKRRREPTGDIPRDLQPRYDPEKAIYRDCRWCNGQGCVACPGEADKEYKRQFPEGPKPIATFKLSEVSEIGRLKSVLGPQAVMAAKAEGDRLAAKILKKHPAILDLTHLTPDEAKRALGTSLASGVIHENLVKSQKKKRKPKGKGR